MKLTQQLLFIPLFIMCLFSNSQARDQTVTRKPIVFIVQPSKKLEKIYTLWNSKLGQDYDIVSDAPIKENVAQLEQFTKGQKAWMCPSVKKIKEGADEFGKSVTWIFYDHENWKHTPKNEQNDIVAASKALRKLADKNGWKTAFIPMYGHSKKYAAILAPYYDAYLPQCQKFQNSAVINKTVRELREIKKIVKKANPKCKMGCQLGVLNIYGEFNKNPKGNIFRLMKPEHEHLFKKGSGVGNALNLYSKTEGFLELYSVWWNTDQDSMISFLEKVNKK